MKGGCTPTPRSERASRPVRKEKESLCLYMPKNIRLLIGDYTVYCIHEDSRVNYFNSPLNLVWRLGLLHASSPLRNTMPKMTIYIRDEDLDKWLALQNKSETIHNLLNPGVIAINILPTSMPTTLKEANDPTSPAYSARVRPTLKTGGVCKIHGIPLDSRGRCLQKGCKYA